MNRASFRFPSAVAIFAMLIAGASVDRVSAQGLLGIGEYGSEISESVPFRLTAGVVGGYDSNTNTASDDGDKVDSYFAGGDVGLFYAYADKTTRLDIGGGFEALYYDQTATGNDVVYNSRFTANLGHRISERMRLTNNGLVAYEVEPDYLIAASSALRDGQYLYWFNRTALWYDLAPRITSVTSYAFSGIDYEAEVLRDRENRMSHLIGQQIRYSLSRRTSVRAEYRYGITDYKVAPYDSTTHYILGGAEHRFSEVTTLSFAAGAEYRHYDGRDSFWKPYGEIGLRHHLSDRTYLRFMGRAGLEDNEVFGFRDRYSFRTGVDMVHQLADRLRGNAGVSYIYSDFDGTEAVRGITEDGISAQVGLAYRLLDNLELFTRYYYTNYSSDEAYRNYDRHRISVGANAKF